MGAIRSVVSALVVMAVFLVAVVASGGNSLRAQSWPDGPLKLVVGFPPGGPNDILGRLIGGALATRLGHPVQIENLPGASGNLATEAVVRARPDGRTLLLIGPANAINTALFQNLTFDFTRDILPVAGITREPLVMLVHPSVPAKNVEEFLAFAKANLGKFKMASTGNGSSPHVSGLLFNNMTGIAPQIVQYNGGGPALKGMIAGEAHVMFEPMSASIEPVRAGQLRALAVTTSTASDILPGVPTIAATAPGYEASAVTGIAVPAGTPAEIVEKLNREINAAIADPQFNALLKQTGGAPLTGSSADFARMIAGEISKWGGVVKAAGLRPQ